MGGFHTLDREQAARILFADRLDDPGTDFTTDAFESGADVAESLASWFGFTDDDYAAIRHARKLRAIAEQGSLHADPKEA